MKNFNEKSTMYKLMFVLAMILWLHLISLVAVVTMMMKADLERICHDGQRHTT